MIKGVFNGYIPSIFWTIIIVSLSVMPGESLDGYSWSDMWNIDKLGHLIFYGTHTFLLLYAMNRRSDKLLILNYRYLAPFLSILLGLCMELIQYQFFADRHFDVLDLIANIIGSLVGLIIFKILKK